MRYPETSLQLGFDQIGEERLLSSDTPKLFQAIDGLHPVVVYFEERLIREITPLAIALKKHLEAKGRQARIVHYQQLLPGMAEELRWPIEHFGFSPFDDEPKEPCVVIVENFSDFDEKNIAQVLEKIKGIKPSISWLFLVPTWESICPSRVFKDWCVEKNPRKFRLVPNSA